MIEKQRLVPFGLALAGANLLFAANALFRSHEDVVFGFGVRDLGLGSLGLGALCLATALALAIRGNSRRRVDRSS